MLKTRKPPGYGNLKGGEQSLADVYGKLEQILSELSALPWLTIGSLGEKAVAAQAVFVPDLPAGQANWMVDALRSENLPWG